MSKITDVLGSHPMDGSVVIRKPLIEVVGGDLVAAIFLSEAVFFVESLKDGGDSFWFNDSLGYLSYEQIKQGAQVCEARGFLKWLAGNNAIFVTLDKEELVNQLQDIGGGNG